NRSSHSHIVKRHGPISQNLYLLMALACQQHNVSSSCRTNRNRNCPRTVYFYDAVCACCSDTGQRFFNNGHRLFTARIVAGQDNQIAPLTGSLSHPWTFRTVPIPAATKQRNHPATALMRQLPRQSD